MGHRGVNIEAGGDGRAPTYLKVIMDIAGLYYRGQEYLGCMVVGI